MNGVVLARSYSGSARTPIDEGVCRPTEDAPVATSMSMYLGNIQKMLDALEETLGFIPQEACDKPNEEVTRDMVSAYVDSHLEALRRMCNQLESLLNLAGSVRNRLR